MRYTARPLPWWQGKFTDHCWEVCDANSPSSVLAYLCKFALAKKREGMETEKTSVHCVREAFEKAPFQADLKPK